MCLRESQQISVSYLGRREKSRQVELRIFKQANLVGPEGMSRGFSQLRNGLSDSGRTTRRICVRSISCNSDSPIFSDWTRCPGFLPLDRKPVVRDIVLRVRRVNQRDQDVHIKEKGRQGSSSRNRLTSSKVAGFAFGCTGSRGMPLRYFRSVTLLRSAWRLRAEMTSPTVLCCRDAISLAAARMSSSMDSVVRIGLPELHQSSLS